MQQILNYTPKVERLHHQYQGQGEVNKTLLYEDFFEKSEEAKDKVLEAEPSDEKLIKDENRESSSQEYIPNREKRKQKEKKIENISEEDKKIDLKV